MAFTKEEELFIVGLYEKYVDDLFLFIYLKLKDWHESWDITHDVFLLIQVKIKILIVHPYVWGWLVQTARYLIINYFRKINMLNSVPIPRQTLYPPDEMDKLCYVYDNMEVLNESIFDMDFLSFKEKEYIKLRYYEGYNCKEIAILLGISQNYIYTFTRKIKRKSKKYFIL